MVCIDIETCPLPHEYFHDPNNPDPLKKSLNPLKARICCIGIKNDEIEVILLDEDEKKLLENFWKYLEDVPTEDDDEITFVGYNIDYFDIPFIRFRSLVHNVPSCLAVTFGKHTFDLMTSLFPPGQYKKFKDVAEALGIPHNGGLNGSDIPRLWLEKKYDEIRKHCLDDIRGEWELFKKIEGFYSASS